jgi:hypothetical protein
MNTLCESVGELLPNFDAVNSVAECEAHRHDLWELEEGIARLTLYVESKRAAVQFRLAGNIPEALKCERTCQEIFEQLPKWARW